MALVMKPPPQLGTGARQRFGAASYWLEWSASKIRNVREVAGTRFLFLGVVAQYMTVLGELVEDGGLYEMSKSAAVVPGGRSELLYCWRIGCWVNFLGISEVQVSAD